MIRNRLSWMIGGPQGSGINFTAEAFAKACFRGGLNVFSNIEYHSNIKGEHSYFRVRVDEREICSHLNWIDLLVALDKETIFGDTHKQQPTHPGHRHEVTPGSGGIILDSDLKLTQQEIGRSDIKLFSIPFKELLLSVLRGFRKEKELSKYQVMTNTIALGVSAGLLEYEFTPVADVVKESFTGRKAELAEINLKVAEEGYNYAKDNFRGAFEYRLESKPTADKRVLIRGVQAVALGKLKAGCGLQTYYPITPATDESEYLETYQRNYDVVVLQAEDEIAAFLMAAGAAHAGIRSATSTSGPGFSLMVEGLGWAAMSEAPGVVLLNYQRGGPSTGMPTRTEQSDLRFALHASHGEFPRIVICSGDQVECFYDTFDAFNWAEKFQMPVILIADKHLAGSYRSVPFFDGEDLKVDRGQLLGEDDLGTMEQYRRYTQTATGISPRSKPGQKGGIFWAIGEEHDELGHMSESSENRVRMMRKRMKKLQTAAALIADEKKLKLHGPTDADVTLAGWGSTKGAIIDAMGELQEDGYRVNFLQFRYMSPFPNEAAENYLNEAKRKIIIENNYSAQLAGVIREHTGIEMDQKIVRFDGRPFGQNDVYDAVLHALRTGEKEVIVPNV
ncbi:MAG: 2-oxoacid:acceptor oxidoreductase subunit alpha [Candidatus Bathyarchaeia archaeon]